MERILITEEIRTREDFYGALGRLHGCDVSAPRNLDDLADFLRQEHIRTIVASDMELEAEDYARISTVLQDQGVRLAR